MMTGSESAFTDRSASGDGGGATKREQSDVAPEALTIPLRARQGIVNSSPSNGNLLRLQRLAGNRAVTSLVQAWRSNRIQRASSWGGEYTTDKYEVTTDPGMDGVEIELRFKPNEHANATTIGMVQTVRSVEKGVPFALGSGADKSTLESRQVPKGEPGEGTWTDRLPKYGSPMYGAGSPAPGDTLASTPIALGNAEYGKHYTDAAGKLQEHDALLKDRPQLRNTRAESSQVFESTALATAGEQQGAYYGSVEWGWRKDAAGTVTKVPLTVVSNDAPSGVFTRASEMWNQSKTSEGKETLDLPLTQGKYVNTDGCMLVSNPSKYKETKIIDISKNTRVEVTDKAASSAFNKAAAEFQWWKVTVVSGPAIGKVGWVMQTNLADMKAK